MALTKIGRLVDKGIIKDQTNLGTQAADTDEYLLYDASADALKSIAASNVTPNETLITSKDEITIGNVQGNDVLLIYDTSAGVLKKITKTAFDALQPGFSSATPSNLLSGDGTGNYTIVIAGSDFDSAATFKLVTDGGTDIAMDTVVRDSAIQLTGTIAKNTANLTNANEPFDIVITNGNGLSTTSANAITIDAQPAWVTSSGSLGTVADAARGSLTFTIQATDPESGALTINTTLVSGTLPAGSTLVDNGDGTATISGFSAVGSNTTSTFTVRAADANSNFADRQFSITVNAPAIETFNSSGTFSVPSGLTAVDVLVVAGGGGGGGFGGGGGAGGLIFRPGFPVTPGGTVSVTVGDGGAGANDDNSPGVGANGQDSVFGTLTAKGGGYGGGQSPQAGAQGGSGGGSGRDGAGSSAYWGNGTQPTQPGDSGTYGFGNDGAPSPGPNSSGGGGGGGAGAAGNPGAYPDSGVSSTTAGNGGIGRAYTIADGSTPVYYAGGGGGAFQQSNVLTSQGGFGGGGAGGAEVSTPNPNGNNAVAGAANRGGGGGSSRQPLYGAAGGKGVVIVKY